MSLRNSRVGRKQYAPPHRHRLSPHPPPTRSAMERCRWSLRVPDAERAVVSARVLPVLEVLVGLSVIGSSDGDLGCAAVLAAAGRQGPVQA